MSTSHDQGDYLQRHLMELSNHYPLWVDDDYRFAIVQDVRLPPGYARTETDFLVVLPSDYPFSPPGIGDNRIYTSPSLRFHGRALTDLHPSTTPKYSAPGFGPWAWFCYEHIAWNPLSDDLIAFFEMVRTDLTDPRT